MELVAHLELRAEDQIFFSWYQQFLLQLKSLNLNQAVLKLENV